MIKQICVYDFFHFQEYWSSKRTPQGEDSAYHKREFAYGDFKSCSQILEKVFLQKEYPQHSIHI